MAEKIRSAVYSNIHVYELPVNNAQVMIRKSDSWVNATQILRAAGLPKPSRTKVLEKEVCTGIHEKVQGGYAGSQGTWVPLDVAKTLAKEYYVYDECKPLFEYDMNSGLAESSSPPMKSRIVRPVVHKPYSDSSDST
ncbi:transcriptional regulator swi6 [Kappamyces sp. JEL0680]|nr:transcriptional regulator swi6 [Kappamyces sp. JEL0680]